MTACTNSNARLEPVSSRDDVFGEYRGTPIETLLLHHNLGVPADPPDGPALVILTCMDHRISLRTPDRFAFQLRTAGANAAPVMFNISCAAAITGVSRVAVIGHTDCAMCDVERHRDRFIESATRSGSIPPDDAARSFEHGAASFGFDDTIGHTLAQCEAIARGVPGVAICPLLYDVEDGLLYQIAAQSSA